MSRVRIKDLGRKMGVKNKRLLKVLSILGIHEKATLDNSQAAKACEYLRTHPWGNGGKPQFIVLMKDERKSKPKRRKNLNLVKTARTGSGVSGIYNWTERGGFPYGG